jgi:hypothetical protein
MTPVVGSDFRTVTTVVSSDLTIATTFAGTVTTEVMNGTADFHENAEIHHR